MAKAKKAKAAYADGYLIAVPKKNIQAYRRMSQKAGEIWKEFGALDYKECVGDDIDVSYGVTFADRLKGKRGEVPVFSWITYKSKADRDKINKKVFQSFEYFKVLLPP